MGSSLSSLRRALSQWLPPSLLAAIKFYRRHGYLPSVRAPKTFSEHLHVRKLFDNDERFAVYADKLRVKEIVRRELGESWLIPTIWSGERLPDQFPGWQMPFVLKANFGSGLNKFIREPEDLDWAGLRRLGAEWMDLRWPRTNSEEWYNLIPRRLLVEPMLGDGDLPDYKFWVFGGKVEYIELNTGRFSTHCRTFYSSEWQRQEFTFGYPPRAAYAPPPRHLVEMLSAASILGAPFPFARIDLYDLLDHPRFGEVTFTPARGLKCFQPVEIDAQLGRIWSAAATRQA